DDVAVLDALLDAGADIEADGAVIGGGTPLADACAFGQWKAAHRLVEHGASANLWQAAALDLLDRLTAAYDATPAPTAEDTTHAFWCACHGGRRRAAEFLLGRGADVNWVGYDDLTPFDAARRAGADDLVAWLHQRGARSTGNTSQLPC
nr:ankyrin repeat domain-containing protein [Micromonospora sp. DSM 115978]